MLFFFLIHSIYFTALNIIPFTQRMSILRAVWNLTGCVRVCVRMRACFTDYDTANIPVAFSRPNQFTTYAGLKQCHTVKTQCVFH